MTTNAQQYSGDFFRSSADFHQSLFAQISEEWANRRESEQEYNEWLQSRIDTLNNTVRQYGVIRDTQENREMGDRFSLARLEQQFEGQVTAAQARTVRAAVNGLDDLRTTMRRKMSGEAGDTINLSSLLLDEDNNEVSFVDARDLMVQQIHDNATLGNLFGREWAGPEGIGQASRGARIALALGGVDAIMRMSAGTAGPSIDEDQAREVMAQALGIEPNDIDERVLAGQQQLITSQTISATANMPSQSEQLQWLKNDSQFWGNTPEMQWAATQLTSSEAERDEVQAALDARLETQSGRNEEAEIEETMRARAGRVGAGADLGGGIFGAIRRSRAQDRWEGRQSRHRDMTEGQQILFGSFGEAEALTDQFGFNAPTDGQSWDVARDLMDQGSSGGWSSPEELVRLAGELSGGDQALRNEILRNVTYLKMSGDQSTALRTPEQQRQEEGLASRRLMWTDYFAERGQPVPEGFDLESMERPSVAIEMAARNLRAQDPNQEEVNFVPLGNAQFADIGLDPETGDRVRHVVPEDVLDERNLVEAPMRERRGNIIRSRDEDPSFLPDYVLAERATMPPPPFHQGALLKPKPTRSGKPTRTAYDKVLLPSINTTKGQ